MPQRSVGAEHGELPGDAGKLGVAPRPELFE